MDAREPALFLTEHGEPLTRSYLSHRVGSYVKAANIGKQGACHLFRHTMATVMLEAGADVRFIQEMLGHANLETTEIYTRVSIRMLKAVYEATHPAAKKARARPTPASSSTGAMTPPVARAASPSPRDELLSSLAAEEDNDADELE